MSDATTLHFYKRNVPYLVGLRYYIGDKQGKTLTDVDPYIAIEAEDLRDFKRANKYHLDNGLIIETTEPEFDDETPNAITDEQAAEYVKNVFALKKILKEINSEAIVAKLFEVAKELGRPQKTLDLIIARLDEVAEVSPTTMRGVEDARVDDLRDRRY